jgi:hypothetical protein
MSDHERNNDAPGGLAQKLVVPLGNKRELIILVCNSQIDFVLSEEGGKFASFVRFEIPAPSETRR